jgi:transposase-like protein
MKAQPKKQPSDMDLMKLFEQFGSDQKCRMYLERLRWPNGIRCIRCDSIKVSMIYKRNQFTCDTCDYRFSVTAGTIFHDSHLPLPKWFAAVFLICESKKGMSALQLKRTLKVAYKTAWYLCHRIREAVKDADCSFIGAGNVVEVDETYIGGKAKNMHKDVRERHALARRRRPGTAYDNKTMVVGAIERGGPVRLQVCGKTPNKEVLHAFIKAKLADETQLICTDDWKGYEGIADDNTIHASVSHSRGEYVRGQIHTNTLESVWSLFKRSIVGSYHQISVKHMDRYLDEFEFRFNNRHNPYLFRDTLRRLLASGNLEYKELTKKDVV